MNRRRRTRSGPRGVLAGFALFAPWLAWWGTWAALTLAAAARWRRRPPPAPTARFDVVIPAHDEAGAIGALLDSLRAQSAPDCLGRVLVVADHCTDATAAVARDHGAEVLVRDDGPAGKPPSLAAGIAALAGREGRGDAVVLIDADCVCDPGFLAGLRDNLPGADALQGAYTLIEPDEAAVRANLRRAFALRNVVRARGSAVLGLPCMLFGSGIVLRWSAADTLSWVDPRIAGTGDSRPVGDDVAMAYELLGAGVHVRFAAEAGVAAPTPADDTTLGAQRLRWEGGQALQWRQVAPTARACIARRDVAGLVGLIDWTAPPLVPTAAAFGAAAGAAGLAAGTGLVPATVLVAPSLAAGALGTSLVVGIGLLEGPGGVVRTVLGAPRLVAWKLGLYRRHGEARRPATRGSES